MPLIGKLIKTAIHVSSEFVQNEENPFEKQQEVLSKLLHKAKDTAFGKKYQFDNLLNSERVVEKFRTTVPAFDYNRMKKQWWHRTIAGEKDISWPGSPHYFALSSGTTGSKSKKIPVTEAMIETIRDTGMKQILSLSNHELPDAFFEKQVMMLGSSTDLEEVNGHYEGEISGISASNIPFWFKGYYKPGENIAQIEDWDERIQKIAEKAPEWDIGSISGIPSWIELMLKKVIEVNKLNTIHDIWPDLAVYTSGGVAFDAYQKRFEQHLERPLLYLDTYLASEGFIAYQSRPSHQMAMQLAYEGGIYFEFIPFDEQYFDEHGSPVPDAPALSLAEVDTDTDYALLISTVSGAWRYSIGDTIRFTDVEKAEIKITGRTKHFLNVTGAQLSVSKMNEAIQQLEKKYDIAIPEFTVGAIEQNGEFVHQWFLGSDDADETLAEELKMALDSHLKSSNKNYKVARGKALKDVKVTLVKTNEFHNWSEKNKKKGGQVKTPRMMDSEALKEFEHFVS